MDGGAGGILGFGGGKLKMKLCSTSSSNGGRQQSCCEATRLNTNDNNWEPNEVNFFVGRQLGGCSDFFVNETNDEGLRVTLAHSGSNAVEIKRLYLLGSKREMENHFRYIF